MYIYNYKQIFVYLFFFCCIWNKKYLNSPRSRIFSDLNLLNNLYMYLIKRILIMYVQL